MFYVIENLKGKPFSQPNSLLFGTDEVYDYYVLGTKSPKVRNDYNSGYSDSWKSYNQPYKVDDFIKQIKAISKRDKFEFKSRSF